ncbi:hypothetical protein KEM52_006391, partial [Ascosphaera acerosa]
MAPVKREKEKPEKGDDGKRAKPPLLGHRREREPAQPRHQRGTTSVRRKGAQGAARPEGDRGPGGG